MKGDNFELRRRSGAAARMGRFGVAEFYSKGTSEEEILKGMGGLRLSCLSFDLMKFNSIRIVFAGVLFKNFKQRWRRYTLLVMRLLMGCKTHGILAWLRAFLANIF